ncbi:MAG: hypothetical protein VX278_16460 [Myxococcota bacterium]|nr:hypothetical protein [Myxococcota bacterium]
MPQRPNFGGFDTRIPPFTRKVLFFLFGLYVLQLILTSWIGFPLDTLAWQLNTKFSLWQPFTSFLVIGKTSPLWFLIDLLMVFFFLPPLQRTYGRRALYKLLSITVGVCIVLGAFCMVTGAAVAGPFYGIEPFLSAAIVAFCFTNPNAQILIFFVIPVKSEWIAWFTGIFSLLLFLAGRDLSHAMYLGGWIGGVVFLAMRNRGPFKKYMRQWKKRQKKKARKPFTIIDGGKDTYH